MNRSRRRRLWVTLLLIVAAFTMAMVAVIHRYGYREAPEVPLITAIKASPDPAYPYSLAFIQFNDKGRFQSRSQLDNLLTKIQSEAQDSGAVIGVFIHGWNNTCDECSESVRCFERQLAFISQLQSLYKPARRVYGVYLGWRGVRIAPPEYNTALTFADRREVADRLGSAGDLRETIEKLGAVRKSLRRKSVLIVTGHSLGGRALFKAMTAAVNEKRNTLATLEDFSDLLVLFNPALSAVDYLPVDIEAAERAAKALRQPGTVPEPPKMITLGSESDYVTQMVYPFSEDRRWLMRLWKDDRLEHFTTVGNFSSFYTHRLTLTRGQVEPTPPVAVADGCACTSIRPTTFRALIEARQGRTGNNSDVYDYANIQMPGGVNNSKYEVKLVALGVERGAYAVIQVDRRLMNGHSGIYTPAIAEFLTRVANQRFFRRNSPSGAVNPEAAAGSW